MVAVIGLAGLGPATLVRDAATRRAGRSAGPGHGAPVVEAELCSTDQLALRRTTSPSRSPPTAAATPATSPRAGSTSPGRARCDVAELAGILSADGVPGLADAAMDTAAAPRPLPVLTGSPRTCAPAASHREVTLTLDPALQRVARDALTSGTLDAPPLAGGLVVLDDGNLRTDYAQISPNVEFVAEDVRWVYLLCGDGHYFLPQRHPEAMP